MAVNYKDGRIVVEDAFHCDTLYDVANNLISAQFNGKGAISKYAVMNKFSVFSAYYTLMSVNGVAFDWNAQKTVTMVGKKQVTTFSAKDFDMEIIQFLDQKSNCIYVQNKVKAKKDMDFRVVNNFGINYSSYVEQLLANRLSAKTVGTLLAGFVKSKKNGLTIDEEGIGYIRGDVLGDFYLDIAISSEPIALEAERGFVNQFGYGSKIAKGETKIYRYTISAGTRIDFTYCDVKAALKNFDNALKESDEYIDSLKCPVDLKDEFLKAYYKSLLNTSLSNYKELNKFKGFLAGLVYQFPARTYYRDAYWTVLSVLPVRPELVRNEIITLANGINSKGECPSAVKFNFKNYWGNHYDSPSFFVMMLYDYIAHTNDKSILNEAVACGTVLDSARLVLDRLYEEVEVSTGLLLKGGPYNRRDWCDNVFRSTYCTYDEVLYCRALYCLSEIYALSDDQLSRKYAVMHEQVKKSINDLLWDEEKGWYINYKSEDFVEDNLSIDTVVAALFKVAPEDRAKRMLQNMEKYLESKNNTEQAAGDFGTLAVYPFYKNIQDIVQKSSLPYYYHNGGDWPYLSCVYSYAKLMYGMDYMYPLTRWFTYNIEKGNYTPIEFFSPFHKDGSLLQAWSSTGAFVLSYPDGSFFSKKIEK